MDPVDDVEQKFSKSGTNRKTENAGLALLLRDPRFQAPAPAVKVEILVAMDAIAFGTRAFDAVMTDAPIPPLELGRSAALVDLLYLVEMKTTRKPISDRRLEGFFFGATEREFQLAEHLGDRYLFAFVVLNTNNVYGREFFVLLTYRQLVPRMINRRVQFQVNLRRGFEEEPAAYGSGPGDLLLLGFDDATESTD